MVGKDETKRRMSDMPLRIYTLPISTQPWDIFDSNGKQGDFIISDLNMVNNIGNISGKINQVDFNGQWDENLHKITFTYTLVLPFIDSRNYTGYMFKDETNPSLITLTGFYEHLSNGKQFGWYAQTQI